MLLTELKTHIPAVITDLAIESIPIKIFEMGCLPGKVITLLRKAPFHGPLYIQTEQAYLVIRADTAKFIQVSCITE